MKGACTLILTLSCLILSVQSHEFIHVQRTSNDVVVEGASVEIQEATFPHYSGYVTVNPNADRVFFYRFIQSEHASAKPLVLWLNGAPHGCTALGAGAMRRLGLVPVNPDGKTLWHNKNAWNNVANIIFVESPEFLKSNTSSDYATQDNQTSSDAYTFLVNWLEIFPEYKTRDLYIIGETSAWKYIPQLAALILKNNKIPNQTVLNLKGITIGNAYCGIIKEKPYVWKCDNCFPSTGFEPTT